VQMLSAGGTARRLLERGRNASGFVAIKAPVVSCAIDHEKPTSRYRSGQLPRSPFLDHFRLATELAVVNECSGLATACLGRERVVLSRYSASLCFRCHRVSSHGYTLRGDADHSSGSAETRNRSKL
jgi:hypothetical protein